MKNRSGGRWRLGLDRRRRRRLMQGPVALAERVAIRLGLWFIPRGSRACVWRWGGRLGVWAFFLDRRGRRIAEANLWLVYGERMSSRRRRAMTMISYRHAARVLLDIFWFTRHRAARLRQWCVIDPSDTDRLRHQPGFLLTAHLGNWEVAGQALAAAGVPLTSVAKPIGSPRTTTLLNQMRGATGQDIVLREGAVRGMVRAVRSGRTVAVLQDQHTDLEDGGIFVDFLGGTAPVSGAVATLASRLHVPVHLGVLVRDARGRYYSRMTDGLVLPPGADIPEGTQQLTDVLTRLIRRYPGQWLWMYRRWKQVPPGGHRSRFPFYARRLSPSTPWSSNTASGAAQVLLSTNPPDSRTGPDAPVRLVRSVRAGPRFLVLALLAGVVILLHSGPFAGWFQDVETLRQAMEPWSGWAPVWIFAVTAVLIACGFPRTVLNGVTGFLFGALTGLLVAHGATLAGNGLQFGFLRWFRRGVRRRERSPSGGVSFPRGHRSGVLHVLLIRLMPVAAIFQNLALLRTRVSWRDFMLGTLVGGLPSTVVAVTIGAGFGEDSLGEAIWPIFFALLLVASTLRLAARFRRSPLSAPLDGDDTAKAHV